MVFVPRERIRNAFTFRTNKVQWWLPIPVGIPLLSAPCPLESKCRIQNHRLPIYITPAIAWLFLRRLIHLLNRAWDEKRLLYGTSQLLFNSAKSLCNKLYGHIYALCKWELIFRARIHMRIHTHFVNVWSFTFREVYMSFI